jgi:hypothetical protein
MSGSRDVNVASPSARVVSVRARPFESVMVTVDEGMGVPEVSMTVTAAVQGR